MNKTAVLLVILASFLSVSTPELISQEIKANVIVNMEQLTQDARVNVATMEQDIMNYINNQKFTNIDWEGPKIQVELNIFLSGGYDGRYSAKLFIISKRSLGGNEETSTIALKLVDVKWSFNYARNATITFNPLRFDELASLIDFYMYLIIGFDMDTYGELSGTPIYEKAKQICQLGASANVDGYQTYSMPGEFTRYNLISELTDLRYEELRKLFFSFFVDGIEVMQTDKEKGLAEIDGIISDMVLYKKDKLAGPCLLIQAFFDAKAKEIAYIFKDYKDKEIFKKLMYLDPSNTTIYEDARDGK